MFFLILIGYFWRSILHQWFNFNVFKIMLGRASFKIDISFKFYSLIIGKKDICIFFFFKCTQEIVDSEKDRY